MSQTADTTTRPASQPDAAPETAPPGTAWVWLPNGQRVLGYPETAFTAQAATGPSEHAPPAPDVWPKRLAAGGGATAAVIAAVGYAGPGLGQAGHAVEMAGVGVGVACASLGALVLLVRGSGGRSGQRVEVNVNVTNSNSSSSVSSARSGQRR